MSGKKRRKRWSVLYGLFITAVGANLVTDSLPDTCASSIPPYVLSLTGCLWGYSIFSDQPDLFLAQRLFHVKNFTLPLTAAAHHFCMQLVYRPVTTCHGPMYTGNISAANHVNGSALLFNNTSGKPLSDVTPPPASARVFRPGHGPRHKYTACSVCAAVSRFSHWTALLKHFTACTTQKRISV